MEIFKVPYQYPISSVFVRVAVAYSNYYYWLASIWSLPASAPLKRSELLKQRLLGFVFKISKLRLQSPFEVRIVQQCTTNRTSYDFGVPIHLKKLHRFLDFYGKKVGFSLGPVSGLVIKSGSASGFTSKFCTVADESWASCGVLQVYESEGGSWLPAAQVSQGYPTRFNLFWTHRVRAKL